MYLIVIFLKYRYIDQALSDSDDNDLDDSTLNSTAYSNSTFNSRNDTAATAAASGSTSTSANNANETNSNNTFLDNQTYQPALLAAAKLNNFVYVLYTLSLLLIGKEKKKVQKSLTKLRLASALNSLFDYLIWNCRCENPNAAGNNQENQQQQQMRSHICPEVAVKIQFLRLVHSFCDHSTLVI